MKKYLLTWALITITATTLYATTAGSTVVDKMKAAAHSFTLSTSLNPTDTGLTSDPVKGKKTGDILTAGEYNRILELLSEGGSGGGSGWVDVPLTDTNPFDQQCMYRVVMQWQTYYPETVHEDRLYWINVMYFAKGNKSVLVGGIAPFDRTTKMEKLCGGGGGGGSGVTSNITWANFDGSGGVAMKWSNGITSIVRESAGNYRVTFATPRPNTDYGVICTSGPSPSYLCFPHEKNTTSFLIKTSNPSNNVDASFVSLIVTPFDVWASSTWTGAGWVDVPLTDTANFDDSCMYRFQVTYTAGGREPHVPKETYYFANGISKTQLVWWLDNDSQLSTFHIAASSKNIFRINGAPYGTVGGNPEVSIIKIEKFCGGGGGSSSSSGWSDISLTGSTSFDINCEYRFKASAPGNVDDDAYIGDDNAYNYIQRVHANRLTYQHIGSSYEHINVDTKTTLRQNGTPTSPAQTITQIQKRCN